MATCVAKRANDTTEMTRSSVSRVTDSAPIVSSVSTASALPSSEWVRPSARAISATDLPSNSMFSVRASSSAKVTDWA